MEVIAGIDIGGTKCAVSFIHMNGDEVEFLSMEKRPTDEPHPDEMVQSFVDEIAEKLNDPSAEGLADIRSVPSLRPTDRHRKFRWRQAPSPDDHSVFLQSHSQTTAPSHLDLIHP